MGIFDDFRAVKNVQDIKKGKTAKLSVAQLACLLINLPDASKNLSAEQFKQVNSLYDEYRKFNTKVIMDMDFEPYWFRSARCLRFLRQRS